MIHKLITPKILIKQLSKIRIFLIFFTIFFLSIGTYYSLIESPQDYQQGDIVRILYIHVPSAWLSLIIFTIIGACSISCLVWKSLFSFIVAKAAAPIGAMFALITLITGSLWGKPIWGDWWVWDARLTSMLILFIFYITFIIVANSSEDIYRVEKPASALAILGLINVPIVKFSVNMWFSLHQQASVFKLSGPSIAPEMLKPLFLMFCGNFLFFLVLLSYRIQYIFYKYKINS